MCMAGRRGGSLLTHIPYIHPIHKTSQHTHVLEPDGHVAVVHVQGALVDGAGALELVLRLLPRRVPGLDWFVFGGVWLGLRRWWGHGQSSSVTPTDAARAMHPSTSTYQKQAKQANALHEVAEVLPLAADLVLELLPPRHPVLPSLSSTCDGCWWWVW